MNPVLERNVEQLLSRSWQRVRPSPGFEDALLADLLARMPSPQSVHADHTVPAGVGPAGVGRRVFLAAAALFLVLGASWIMWSSPFGGGEASSRSLVQLQADGLVAWRDAVEADWHALDPEVRELDRSDKYLEVVTPARRGVHVRLARGLVTLEPLTRVRFTDADESRRVRLDAGALRARVDEGSSAVIDTSEGATRVRRGSLAAGILRASETSETLADVDPTRHVVRLELTHDSTAHLAGAADELPTEVPLFLQGGRLLTAVAVPDGSAREPVPAPGEVPVEVAGPSPPSGLPAIVGHLEYGAGPVPEEIVVWTLEQVDLPKVATPHLHVFPGAAGRFSIQPSEPGSYRVFVEARGRSMWKGEARITSGGEDASLEIELAPGGAVRGFVVDAETGAPIAGALVLAEHDLPHQVIDTLGVELRSFERMPRAHALTGAGGEFELVDLSLRLHVLRVSGEGYAPSWTVDFQVAAGGDGDEPLDLGTIGLGHGGRVVGRVEREDGSAWAGAEVIVSRIEMQRNLSVMTFGGGQTGPEGDFVIEELPEGFYVALNLGEQPNSEQGWSRVKQISVRRGETTRVDFLSAVGRARLFGIVRDVDGEPAGEFNVSIAPAGAKGWNNWTVAPVSAEGRYEFEDVSPGRYGVFVNRNFETMTLVRFVDVPERGSVAADLALPPGEISGVVRDPEGTPVKNVMLLLLHYDEEDEEWGFSGKGGVDSAGGYRFAGLHPGRYVVSVMGQEPALGGLLSEDLSITSSPLKKDFELRPGGGVVVSVKDAAGLPLVGARVGLSQGGRECLYNPEPVTDSNGERPVISLSAGRWTVAVELPGYEAVERELLVVVGESNELEVVLRAR